ncbi:MAG: hypothetical protein WC467_02945 [Patescibacteria group bacterium]
MSFNKMPDYQSDLIKDFEASGMAKPLEKEKTPRKTVADHMIAELYKKIEIAEKEALANKHTVNMVSIKGLRDEIKALEEKESSELPESEGDFSAIESENK